MRREMADAGFGRHRRALLVPGDQRAGYVEQAIGVKKRKELRRQRNRLADLGTLKIDAALHGELVGDALADFLDIEARGWKGPRRHGGCRTRGHPSLHRRRGARSGRRGQGARRSTAPRPQGDCGRHHLAQRRHGVDLEDRLRRDRFARASPGVQLMLDVTEALLAEPAIAQVNSCATADHPMIDHLWRERLPVSDRLIAVREPPVPFSLVCRIEALRRWGIGKAKMVRDTLKR